MSSLKLIGSTPMIRLDSLFEAFGVEIFVKMENMGAYGSVKDRPVAKMIAAALESGELKRGCLCVEATAGNTGIALAHLAHAHDFQLLLTYPAKVSEEKVTHLRRLGAELVECPDCKGTDERHFQQVARRMAAERNGFLVNQFDNPNNALAHYESTGPEILSYVKRHAIGGRLNAFTTSTGTGGTLAGVARYLKTTEEASEGEKPLVYCLDTVGQAVEFNLAARTIDARPPAQLEGLVSVLEGVGSGRAYGNLSSAAPYVDGTILVPNDGEKVAVQFIHFLLAKEGLLLGGSAAANIVGALVLALKLKTTTTTTTTPAVACVACDGGERYESKFLNDEWLQEKGFGEVVTGHAAATIDLAATLKPILSLNEITLK